MLYKYLHFVNSKGLYFIAKHVALCVFSDSLVITCSGIDNYSCHEVRMVNCEWNYHSRFDRMSQVSGCLVIQNMRQYFLDYTDLFISFPTEDLYKCVFDAHQWQTTS